MRWRLILDVDCPDAEDAEALLGHVMGWLPAQGTPVYSGNVVQQFDAEEGVVVVYTDGGCDLRKDGLGAWAYRIECRGQEPLERVEAVVGTTNNIMELTAVLEALSAVALGSRVRLISDSEYVIKGLTQWCRNWVRNGWQTRDGGPVKNRELWEQLIAVYKLHDVSFQHVNGHSGVPGNDRVDELCTEAMQALHKRMLG